MLYLYIMLLDYTIFLLYFTAFLIVAPNILNHLFTSTFVHLADACIHICLKPLSHLHGFQQYSMSVDQNSYSYLLRSTQIVLSPCVLLSVRSYSLSPSLAHKCCFWRCLSFLGPCIEIRQAGQGVCTKHPI